jgi:hypothetical protein
MAGDIASLRRSGSKGRGEPFRHLNAELQDCAWDLYAIYLERAHERYGPILPKGCYAGICAAASRVAQHGPPPNRWQRLGYRTAKRKREWAKAFPGVPYPGKHGLQ